MKHVYDSPPLFLLFSKRSCLQLFLFKFSSSRLVYPSSSYPPTDILPSKIFQYHAAIRHAVTHDPSILAHVYDTISCLVSK